MGLLNELGLVKAKELPRIEYRVMNGMPYIVIQNIRKVIKKATDGKYIISIYYYTKKSSVPYIEETTILTVTANNTIPMNIKELGSNSREIDSNTIWLLCGKIYKEDEDIDIDEALKNIVGFTLFGKYNYTWIDL